MFFHQKRIMLKYLEESSFHIGNRTLFAWNLRLGY